MFFNIKNNKQNTFEKQSEFFIKNNVNEEDVVDAVIQGKNINNSNIAVCSFNEIARDIALISNEIRIAENKKK